MKSADIVIGEHYVVGWYGRCEVIEKNVERFLSHGGKSRKDGVRIKPVSSHGRSREVLVSSVSLKQTWSEYQEEREVEKLKREMEKQQRKEGDELLGVLGEALDQKSINPQRLWMAYHYGAKDTLANISLSLSDLEKLIELISDSTSLPSDSSALSQIFG